MERYIRDIWEVLTYFDREEFAHPGLMEWEFLLKLDETRRRAGVPIFISSSYRPGDGKSHGRGWAADLTDDPYRDGISGRWAHRVDEAAREAGFNRRGVYDKHYHVDCDPRLPRDVLWGGGSR